MRLLVADWPIPTALLATVAVMVLALAFFLGSSSATPVQPRGHGAGFWKQRWAVERNAAENFSSAWKRAQSQVGLLHEQKRSATDALARVRACLAAHYARLVCINNVVANQRR